MKHYILLSVLLLCGCNSFRKLEGTSSTSKSDIIRIREKEIVILVTGQSNAVSSTANINPPAAKVWSHTAMVWITHFIGGEYIDGVPTKDNPIVFSAAWVILGDMLAASTGRPAHFINVAHGNTSTRNWMQYEQQMVDAARKYQPTIVIWVQGESDEVENIPQDESYRDMKELINASKEVCPHLQWYVALDGYLPEPQDREQSAIRITQRQLIAEGMARQGPDIDEMRYNHTSWFEPISHNVGYGAEFVYDGLTEHAKAWYNILKGDLL